MLRDYQAKLLAEVEAASAEHRSLLLQLPTGGGKTIIATEVVQHARAARERVYFVCHRHEIIKQTCEALDEAGIAYGVIRAGKPRNPSAGVQVCSVGSLARLPPDADIRLMIWDEAHHVAAKGWKAIKEAHPHARHIGLTATPIRLDGRPLGDHFDGMICGPSTRELIEAGYLKPYRAFAPSLPDLRKIKKVAGDFDKGELEKRMTTTALLGNVVTHVQRLPPGSRALLFAVSVAAGARYVERLRAAGITAALVTGETPMAERDAAIADLRDRRIQVLVNVQIFTEGFDLPEIDAVILCRPTQSLGLFLQMIGRGLRINHKEPTAEDRERRLIIHDHAGLLYAHGMPDDDFEWSLAEGGKRKRKVNVHGRTRLCPECATVHDWAPSCPECDHVYVEADRSFEEVQGELIEIAKIARGPNEYVSINIFKKIVRATYRSVKMWIKEGMPAFDGRMIPKDLAIRWLEDNNKIRPNGNITQTDYANIYGMRIQYVRLLARKGMPRSFDGSVNPDLVNKWLDIRKKHYDKTYSELPDETLGILFVQLLGMKTDDLYKLFNLGMPSMGGGYISVSECLKWMYEKQIILQQDGDHIKPKLKRSPRAKGTVSLTEFAKSTKFCRASITNFISEGMPVGDDGRVDPLRANDWITRNKSCNGSISQKKFALENGRTPKQIEVYIRKGMPLEPDGSVVTERALRWIMKNVVDRPAGNISRRKFSNETGISIGKIVGHIQRGMPCAVDGSVNLQEAKSWIEKNSPPDRPLGNINQKQFAQDTGRKQSLIDSYIRRGMPRAADGSINPDEAEMWIAKNVKPRAKGKQNAKTAPPTPMRGRRGGRKGDGSTGARVNPSDPVPHPRGPDPAPAPQDSPNPMAAERAPCDTVPWSGEGR